MCHQPIWPLRRMPRLSQSNGRRSHFPPPPDLTLGQSQSFATDWHWLYAGAIAWHWNRYFCNQRIAEFHDELAPDEISTKISSSDHPSLSITFYRSAIAIFPYLHLLARSSNMFHISNRRTTDTDCIATEDRRKTR